MDDLNPMLELSVKILTTVAHTKDEYIAMLKIPIYGFNTFYMDVCFEAEMKSVADKMTVCSTGVYCDKCKETHRVVPMQKENAEFIYVYGFYIRSEGKELRYLIEQGGFKIESVTQREYNGMKEAALTFKCKKLPNARPLGKSGEIGGRRFNIRHKMQREDANTKTINQRIEENRKEVFAATGKNPEEIAILNNLPKKKISADPPGALAWDTADVNFNIGRSDNVNEWTVNTNGRRGGRGKGRGVYFGSTTTRPAFDNIQVTQPNFEGILMHPNPFQLLLQEKTTEETEQGTTEEANQDTTEDIQEKITEDTQEETTEEEETELGEMLQKILEEDQNGSIQAKPAKRITFAQETNTSDNEVQDDMEPQSEERMDVNQFAFILPDDDEGNLETAEGIAAVSENPHEEEKENEEIVETEEGDPHAVTDVADVTDDPPETIPEEEIEDDPEDPQDEVPPAATSEEDTAEAPPAETSEGDTADEPPEGETADEEEEPPTERTEDTPEVVEPDPPEQTEAAEPHSTDETLDVGVEGENEVVSTTAAAEGGGYVTTLNNEGVVSQNYDQPDEIQSNQEHAARVHGIQRKRPKKVNSSDEEYTRDNKLKTQEDQPARDDILAKTVANDLEEGEIQSDYTDDEDHNPTRTFEDMITAIKETTKDEPAESKNTIASFFEF